MLQALLAPGRPDGRPCLDALLVSCMQRHVPLVCSGPSRGHHAVNGPPGLASPRASVCSSGRVSPPSSNCHGEMEGREGRRGRGEERRGQGMPRKVGAKALW
jgi:hypothetical protein